MSSNNGKSKDNSKKHINLSQLKNNDRLEEILENEEDIHDFESHKGNDSMRETKLDDVTGNHNKGSAGSGTDLDRSITPPTQSTKFVSQMINYNQQSSASLTKGKTGDFISIHDYGMDSTPLGSDRNNKNSRTFQIVKQTLKTQLQVFQNERIDDSQYSVDKLQQMLCDLQSQNIKIREKIDIESLREEIQQNRIKIKKQSGLDLVAGSTLASTVKLQGYFKLQGLLKESMKMSVDDKKLELSLAQKRRNLTKRTQEDNRQLPEYMIGFNDKFRLRWDSLILLLAIWNCFFIPFEIAFEPPINLGIEVFNNLIDILFYFDIIINFRTTYMTPEGEEVMNLNLIAKRYIFQGTFIFDILSVIPLNALIPIDLKFLDILGILKLVRITRLPKLIERLNLSESAKAVVKVFQLSFMLIFYFHMCACSWFYVVRFNEIWIPAFDFGYYSTDIYQSSIVKQYFSCYHYAVMLLTGNEMVPRTAFEAAFAGFLIIMAGLLNANAFGEMAQLVQMIKKKSQYFQEQIDSASTAMKNIRLPDDLQNEIRDYLLKTQSKLDQQQELNKFLSLISPSLKLKVTTQIFELIIQANPVFKIIKPTISMAFEEQLNSQSSSSNHPLNQSQSNSSLNQRSILSVVVRKLEIQLNGPEDLIVQQGDMTFDIFIIAKGYDYASIKDTSKREYTNFKKLEPGHHFGEISAIFKCPRTASIMSGNYCTHAKLSQENYQSLITEIPQVQEQFLQYLYRYNDPYKKWFMKTLKQLTFFQDIEEYIIHKIMYSFKKRSLDKGEIIFKPGEDISYLRIVQDGIIDIFTYFEQKETVIEKLLRGSIMNYRTFFLEEHSQVYAKAARTSIILEISIDQINEILKEAPIFEKKFLSHQTKILNQGTSFPVDYLLKIPKILNDNTDENNPDTLRRMGQFKLVVMRRIQEIRVARQKPKLRDLVKGMKKGDPLQRMETKRKMLALYALGMGVTPTEQESEQKREQDLQKFKDPDDENIKNKTYLTLKWRIKKILAELDNQEKMLNEMNLKVNQAFSRQGSRDQDLRQNSVNSSGGAVFRNSTNPNLRQRQSILQSGGTPKNQALILNKNRSSKQ